MRNSATWTAFLVMCFALVGLTGLFATFATTIPLERALVRSSVLDQALVPGANLEALRPALGSSGDAVLAGPGSLASRVAGARAAVLADQRRDSANIAYRIRLLVCVITILAAVVGAGILHLARRP